LAESPLVTVSGPNGSGKSLLFEAVALLGRLGHPPHLERYGHLVGPWGDQAQLQVSVKLEADERAALRSYGNEHAGVDGEPPQDLVRRVLITRAGDIDLQEDDWAHLLRSLDALRELPFLQLDFLPADRNIPRGEQPSVNPALLGEEQRESFRQQIVGSYIQPQRSVVSLSGIAPVLASLDYTDLLAEREKVASNGDFDAITQSFFRSTSKQIQRPSLDARSPYGAALKVRTAEGLEHTLDQLSSGEQEALGLMFFVRRLSSRGGVLLNDEPELHLHPALQRSLFAILEGIANRAQVIISTHSPRLVVATSLEAVLHMSPPTKEDVNQLRRAHDEESRLQLLDDLGVHPIEVLQSDLLVIVEGTTDIAVLEALLPVELGRALIRAAGSAHQVEEACKALAAHGGVRFLGIRDRDLLSDAELEKLTETDPNLFVWPARTVENELLRAPLLQKTFERGGRTMSEDDAASLVKSLAERQLDQIRAQLVDAALRRAIAYEGGNSQTLEGLKRYLEEVRDGAEKKLSKLDEVAETVDGELTKTWDDRWFELMDGKRALADIVKESPFKSRRTLVDATVQTLRDHESLVPKGVTELREALIRVASAPVST
jgi:predicted ATPase